MHPNRSVAILRILAHGFDAQRINAFDEKICEMFGDCEGEGLVVSLADLMDRILVFSRERNMGDPFLIHKSVLKNAESYLLEGRRGALQRWGSMASYFDYVDGTTRPAKPPLRITGPQKKLG